MRAGCITNMDGETSHAQIREHVEPGSAVYTDGWRGYNGLHSHFVHETIDHAISYSKGDLHTNSIESFWALFKRGYHGIYDHMSRKHLQRYVDEFVFRFDQRPLAMCGVFANVADQVTDSSQLPYKELTA